MEETMEREGKQVLDRLIRAGHEAYFVGGCVRDKLLGRPLKDIDIATAALPEQVMRLFAKTAPTGLQHGTVTVIMDTYTFEVTTFRKESEYEQYRKPKSVEFISDLNEDLRRRDFTINAMALAADGSTIDPFGGAEDLRSKLIRAVGDPHERFREDALRMLRGIRFACEYGFELEPATWDALIRHAPLLAHVAMERVSAELDKMIEGRAPDRAVDLLHRSGLPRHFKQPIDWPLSAREPLPAPIARGKLERVSGAELRWAALFAGLGMDADAAQTAMKRLKCSGKKTESVAKLLRVDAWMRGKVAAFGGGIGAPAETARPRPLPDETGYEWTALGCVQFGKAAVRDWLSFAAWRAEAMDERGWPPFVRRAADWLERVPVERVTDLNVSGGDVAAELNGKPGPWLGDLLRDLLVDVALGKVPNERTSLLERAKITAKRED
ncbi:CCA tRNA nucleotidyltransferase [Paenibacillus sp. GYB003]|uniref:CCA tRNA nucleotidyltransferase n=1 Tax=Paenibacillus sp. GYB003 TaxID=2994392 RepID=UPI002F96DDA5